MSNEIEILVVEESPSQAEQLKHVLEQHGHRVLVEHDAQRALAAIRRRKPQIVISAVHLPVMNGYALCGEIKADENLKDIPVVLLTSLSDAKDILHGLECGADNFITKPYNEKLLLSRIEYIVLNRELRVGAGTQTGLEIIFNGEKYTITPERQQMVDLLISTYETAVQKNHDCMQMQEELTRLNERLEEEVKERTATLLEQVSQHKRDEAAQRESRQRFESLVHSIDGIVWEMDARTFKFTFVSRQAEKLLGYPTEQWIAETDFWENHLHPDDRSQAVAFCRKAAKRREDHQFDYRLIAADGRAVCFRDIATVDVREDGSVFLRGVMVDITKRKVAGEKLRESEDRYRDLVEHSHDLICTHDLDGRILSVNQAAVKLLGYDQETLLNKNIRDILFAELRNEFDTYVTELQQASIARGLMSVQTKTGDRRIWEYTNTLRTEGVKAPVVRGVAHDITEHKRAEAGLRRSEAQYRRLIDTTYEGVMVFDRDMQITYVNQRLAEMLNVSPEELIGTSAQEFVVDASRDDVEQKWQHRVEGVNEQYDLRIQRKDGSALWVIVSATPIFDEHGEFAGSLSMLTDITKRKQAEENLRQRESQLAEAQRIAHIGSWSWDLQGDNVSWSDEQFRLFGVSPQEFTPSYEGLLKYIHPDDRDLFTGTVESSLRTHEPFGFYFRVIMPDGDERILHGLGNVISDDQGNPVKLFGTSLDVTKQRRAETALKASESELRALFAAMTDVIVVLDAQGRYLKIAPTDPASLYRPSADLIGKTIHEVFPKEEADFFFTNIRRVLDEGRMHRVEYSLQIDGAKVWFDGCVSPLSNDSVIWIARDITKRKNSEEALRESEERLHQSQKMEAIGTLAGGVAHDFNNLLTAILGNTQLVLRNLQPDDPAQLRLIEVEKAGNRAAVLTRQLLAFSRRQHLERHTINLNETIGEIMRLLRRIIGEDVEVRVKAASNLAAVFADPAQIEQVVMNLAVNARDAMPEGGSVTIETSNIELDEAYSRQYPYVQPGKYVELRVSDTGIGIDPETRAHIFEPFFTTKEVGHGTGLGLSMVYGIVKQHDGHINVYSEVGHGTTFKIFLPVVEKAVEKEAQAVQLPLLGGTETILVAEDEGALRNLAKDILEGLGYTVLLAENGEEAVKIYEEHRERINMLLLDVVMPRMGGSEAYERIRQLGGDVALIFMTGYSSETVQSRFVKQNSLIKELDAVVIHKPYSIEGLGRKVRAVLDGKMRK